MDRMLVIVFQNQSNAYEGKKALLELDDQGSITLYAYAVVAKNVNGTASAKQAEDFGPLGAPAGASLESLVSLLGEPSRLTTTATVGLASAATANLRIGADFIDDVKEVFLPWRFALAAEVDEDSTAPVDIRMEAIGGTVLRRALSEVKDLVDEKDLAAIKADIAQLRSEHAKAHADRKAKLQEKINQLDSRLEAQLQKAKDRHQAAQREAHGKVQVLKAKRGAAKASAS